MKRGYTAQQYINIIDKLRVVRPDIAMSSDFIVGFPGETHEDFLETMRLIERIKFDVSFSFIYSARPGTPAAELPDLVPYNEKLHRLQTLQAEIFEYAKTVSAGMVGTVEKVLVEGLSTRDPSELYGRTENNRIVNFKPPVGVKNVRQKLIGQMVDMRITQAMTNTLRGDLAMNQAQIEAFTPMNYGGAGGFISIPVAQI
jgi:tRNA-2-methylthio-N6-dimethylallyladenosine synthase